MRRLGKESQVPCLYFKEIQGSERFQTLPIISILKISGSIRKSSFTEE